jgi:hypothetical protein
MKPKSRPLIRHIGLVGLLLAVLTGCVPVALHPFYTEKDIAFDPALLGVWAEKEGEKDTWIFETGTNQSYRLTIKDDKRTDHVDAILFRLGTNTFLDLTAGEHTFTEHKLDGFSAIHLMPVHSVSRVLKMGSELQLAFMDLEWLKKLLEKNPTAIRHEKITGGMADGQLVLTASTQELQNFVQKHLGEVFLKDPDSLKRVTRKP